MKILRLPHYLVIVGLLIGVIYAQEDKIESLLAKGDGISISRVEIERLASSQFESLKLERTRFEADQKKKRHKIMEDTLNRVIKNEVLALEASNREITVKELTNIEVNSKVTVPTDEDVDKFYTSNKNRLKEPKEKLAPQIKNYLKRQKTQTILDTFVDSLRKKYGVTTQLEPLRFSVEPGNSPSFGDNDAKVTLVEFSDFECPYCSRLAATLNKVKQDYADKIKLVFRQYPLVKIHPKAYKAAEAALCAAEQNQFWEMHDLLFEDRKTLAINDLKEKANQLSLDMEKFNTCLDEGHQTASVRQDLKDGMKVGVSGTPALFINGRFMSGASSYEKIVAVIEEELAASK